MLKEFLEKEDFLREAWTQIKKSKEESYGISEETIGEFKTNLDTRLKAIRNHLIHGYQFSPYRAVVIPKKNKKFRPLRVPDVPDRVVLKGMAILIERQLTEYFKPTVGVSFAFQKDLGVKDAVRKIMEYYSQGYKYVLEADIRNFFGEVDRTLLVTRLFKEISDHSLKSLVEQSLYIKTEGLDRLKNDEQRLLFKETDKGIPQGSALSPLLANFYLQPFDLAMIEQGFRLVRYADDFVVMCKSEAEAVRAYEFTKRFLNDELSLSIYPLEGEDKSSRIVNIDSNQDFSFLSISFDGKQIFPSSQSVKSLKEKIDTICFSPGTTVWSMLNGLKFSLDGWITTYSYTDVERHFKDIDTEVNRNVLVGLRNLGWRFTKSSKAKIPVKQRRKYGGYEMLSPKQRGESGVPLCKEILAERRGNSKVLKLTMNTLTIHNRAIPTESLLKESNKIVSNHLRIQPTLFGQ